MTRAKWSSLGCAIAMLAVGCANARDVYRDATTGFSVKQGERVMRGIGISLLGVMAADGDRGEAGKLHPAVIEFVLGSADGSLARYYALIINHPAPPDRARRDILALEPEAIGTLPPGARPSGADYARALARRLSVPINRALAIDGSFGGTAALHWGVAADLEAGILLGPEQRERSRMSTVIHRYERTRMVISRSNGTHRMLAWDLSAVPGAFDPGARLDYQTVASAAVPLHPQVRE